METPLYNIEGKEIEKISLPKEIFEVEVKHELIHQIFESQRANQRKVIAHTKDRSEVSGGGKKPWRQKGTGRARHGSNRSPIWRKGGVTFGPTNERNFKKTIPNKMRIKGLLMVLSAKAVDKRLFVVEELKLEKPKTKKMVKMIDNMRANVKEFEKGSVLLALPELNKNVILSTRNIVKTKTIEARNLNVLELLNYKNLIISKSSIKVIKETFLKK
ncbi:MAG: 50S ribosomal protein L4 [Patescibacteria group bacterium]